MIQRQLDEIWAAVAHGKHALVLFREATNEQELAELAKPILDFLRPCGVLEETPNTMLLANNAWLLCRCSIPVSAKVMNRMKNEMEVFEI